MKKRLIILDFDHTVFNTTLYVEELQKRMEQDFGIVNEEFMKIRNEVKKCCVVIDIDEFVKRLPHPDKTALHRAHHKVIKDYAGSFIFGDVESFINNHLNDFDILLLTHGDKELQTEKIKHSNLPKKIKYLVSTEGKDEVIKDYLKKYDKVYFIDDKAENIDRVKTAFPSVVTYFVVRPEDKPYGHIKSKCDCADYTVEGLKFVIKK